MTALPNPPGGWPQRLTVALQSVIQQLRSDISAIRIRTTQAGRLQLTLSVLEAIGEVKCDGAVYSRSGLPDLARVCGTDFNTGGEGPDEFRVPNIADPIADVEWRISTG